MKVYIVGNLGLPHVGDSLYQAAVDTGHETQVTEFRHAFASSFLRRQFSWRVLGHRPPYLVRFNSMVRRTVADFRPDVLLSTGLSPLTAETLRAIATEFGALRINFSTDDPWNRTMRSNWFFRALPEYDWVFTTRLSNMTDLKRVGVPRVEYMPFAYDPRSAHPVRVPLEVEQPDVLFVGAADRDRVPIIGRLIAEGLRVVVYGLNWQRYAPTRRAAHGTADPNVVRQATAAAKISLCLVRRANRDGHVMRTFEAAAIGTCILAEDTAEHRAIFGNTVTYFRETNDLLASARELLADDARRARLAEAARARIVGGRNTYRDRFDHMMRVTGLTPAPAAVPVSNPAKEVSWSPPGRQ
jgi:hypothetical protein